MKPAVTLFIHSTGTMPGLWKGTPEAVTPAGVRYFPTNLGYPPNRAIPRGEAVTVEAEATALLDGLRNAGHGGADIHIVGHSYGATVALAVAARLASETGANLRSMFLFEPVLFGSLMADIAHLPPDVVAELEGFQGRRWFLDDGSQGGTEPWLEMFIDYWNRPGSWARLPGPMQDFIRRLGWKMFQEVRACFYGTETGPASFALAGVPVVPTTVVMGERTTVSAKAMAHGLAARHRHIRLVALDCGHMGPVTHAPLVHQALAEHSAALSTTSTAEAR